MGFDSVGFVCCFVVYGFRIGFVSVGFVFYGLGSGEVSNFATYGFWSE
jgi:hypothetical protein